MHPALVRHGIISPHHVPLLIKASVHLAAQLVKASVTRSLHIAEPVIVNRQTDQNRQGRQPRCDKRGYQLEIGVQRFP